MNELDVRPVVSKFLDMENPAFICAVLGKDGTVHFQTGGNNVLVVALNQYLQRFVQQRVLQVEFMGETMQPPPNPPKPPVLRPVS